MSKTKKELLNRCFAWETRFEVKSKEALHLDLKLKELNKKVAENAASNLGSSAQNLATMSSLKETVEKLKKSVADLEEKLLDSDNDKAKAEARYTQPSISDVLSLGYASPRGYGKSSRGYCISLRSHIQILSLVLRCNQYLNLFYS